MSFSGAARKITIADIENAAAELDCEVATLRAVMAVESRNSGFDAKRRPIILFEPHVFYRALSVKKNGKLFATPKRDQAVSQGLAYAKWRKDNYPKGSAIEQSDGNYERLTRAIAIHEEAAFQAVSIGMGQVLGENYRLAGCSNACEMFEAAKESEAAQLAQMSAFIKARKIDHALRTKSWEAFARVYNGSGQVTKYSSWLEREYKKWATVATVPHRELTSKDLLDLGSNTIKATMMLKKVATAGAVVGVGTAGAVVSDPEDTLTQVQTTAQSVAATADAISQAKDSVSALTDVAGWFGSHWIVVLCAFAAIVFLVTLYYGWKAIHTIVDERVKKAQRGVLPQ